LCSVRTNASQLAQNNSWRYETTSFRGGERQFIDRFVETNGRFSSRRYGKGIAVYFPLWYPALVFALAGVGVLRFRRQFSIRSALVAVSVVAALLGMTVIL